MSSRGKGTNPSETVQNSQVIVIFYGLKQSNFLLLLIETLLASMYFIPINETQILLGHESGEVSSSWIDGAPIDQTYIACRRKSIA